MDVITRATEGNEIQPFLLWDSAFRDDDTFADWKLAPADEPLNALGLQARHALHTAVLISLFTWRRAEDYEPLPTGNDRKGWWGDAADVDTELGETELGSKLWLLFRSPLNARTQQLAEQYAREALEPLVIQGAVARIDIESEADRVAGALKLYVQMFSQDGDKIYDQRFARVWNQEHG